MYPKGGRFATANRLAAEIGNPLGMAIIENVEVVLIQIRHEGAMAVGDRGDKLNQFGGQFESP